MHGAEARFLDSNRIRIGRNGYVVRKSAAKRPEKTRPFETSPVGYQAFDLTTSRAVLCKPIQLALVDRI
jgi:hypothetical protein